MNIKLIDLAELIDTIRLAKSSIYRLIKAGAFPKPLKLGPRRVAWRESDIAEWLDQQAVGGAQ